MWSEVHKLHNATGFFILFHPLRLRLIERRWTANQQN